MKILAYNASHDGAAALIEDGRLIYSLEAEKDSGPRYGKIGPTLFLRSLLSPETPDVVVIDMVSKPGTSPAQDWVDNASFMRALHLMNYSDESPAAKSETDTYFVGRRVRQFSSSHVRSHIMCGYGLSPFPQGQPCYALVSDGIVGTMYYVDDNVAIHKMGDVLWSPGDKYLLLWGLADPTLHAQDEGWVHRKELPGKLMSLAAFGTRGRATSEQRELISEILALGVFDMLGAKPPPKARLTQSRFCDIGVESQEFKDLAWQFSEAMFDRFHAFAKEHVKQRLPLLVTGGCGLNCEWNSRWHDSGLFSGVFVPPCPNDSGISIGGAIDAQHHYTGNAKIEWSVYAGDPFIEDVSGCADFDREALDISKVCRLLLSGGVIAWVQDKYEIGPRALGNRSMLAAPFEPETRDRLNRIKQREGFRPIAPICLLDEFDKHFENHGPSPHMLYFQRVKSANLRAITHVDGSARAQSVSDAENPRICDLLREFRKVSGVAVLCNTSLNFKGCGFINRLSHLFSYAHDRGLDALVVGDTLWMPRRPRDH